MARQTGIIKIKGTIGDLSFLKTQDGHLVREKGGISAKRMRSDPAFRRTRENGSEFGMATAAGKLLRRALHQHLQQSADNRITSRLVQLLMQVKNYDSVSVRGQRNVGTGILEPAAKEILKGFNFNNRSSLNMVLVKPFSVDELTGTFEIPSLVPINDIKSPEGATHVSISGLVAHIDFGLGIFSVENTAVVNLSVNDSLSQNITLSPLAMPSGNGSMFYILGLRFYQEVNQVQYVLANGVYNALSVVAVS